MKPTGLRTPGSWRGALALREQAAQFISHLQQAAARAPDGKTFDAGQAFNFFTDCRNAVRYLSRDDPNANRIVFQQTPGSFADAKGHALVYSAGATIDSDGNWDFDGTDPSGIQYENSDDFMMGVGDFGYVMEVKGRNWAQNPSGQAGLFDNGQVSGGAAFVYYVVPDGRQGLYNWQSGAEFEPSGPALPVNEWVKLMVHRQQGVTRIYQKFANGNSILVGETTKDSTFNYSQRSLYFAMMDRVLKPEGQHSFNGKMRGVRVYKGAAPDIADI